MLSKNAYFQIDVQEDGTYIKMFPAVGSGEGIKVNEILAFFLRHHISNQKMREIGEAAKNVVDNIVSIKITDEPILPIAESVDIKVSTDRMLAVGTFYPPSTNGFSSNKENIISDLKNLGVVCGIEEGVIDNFLETREYCREFILARGVNCREGKEAVIKYNFNTTPNYQPKENEDGTVDFHQVNFVNNVKEGDILAELVPADLGEAGYDITGKQILPQKVKDARLQAGKNTKLSEDGTKLISEMNGHVFIDNDGRVMVSNILEIGGNVDASTGDINYEGNVTIRGNVNTGYKVEATGNIIVEGVVEGATIISGGDVVLRCGIHGMNSGYLQAEGNLITKFISNTTVVVKGNIETGSILNSDVSSKSEIHVVGKKGLIAGGIVRANILVESQTIGSAMGSNTKVNVGMDAEAQGRIKALTEELKGLQAEELRVRQLFEVLKIKQQQGTLTKDQALALPKTVNHYTQLRDRIDKINKEVEEDSINLEYGVDNARIIVRDKIYPGAVISITGEFLNIKETTGFCKYIKQDGEVKRLTL